jgi:hypothetical protein
LFVGLLIWCGSAAAIFLDWETDFNLEHLPPALLDLERMYHSQHLEFLPKGLEYAVQQKLMEHLYAQYRGFAQVSEAPASCPKLSLPRKGLFRQDLIDSYSDWIFSQLGETIQVEFVVRGKMRYGPLVGRGRFQRVGRHCNLPFEWRYLCIVRQTAAAGKLNDSSRIQVDHCRVLQGEG